MFSSLYVIRGSLNFVKGDLAKARELYVKAIKHKTKKSVVYLNYAIMLLKEGNWQEALSMLQTGASFKHKVLVDKNIFVSIASAYWIGGEIDKALETMHEMKSKYDYLNTNAMTTFGYLYLLKGDFENAMSYTQQSLDDSPTAAAYDNAGQIHLRQNKIEEAKEAFEKAISLQPDIPDSLYFLGIIAETENSQELAAKYFKLAHYGKITRLNTVTREQVDEKYEQYN